MPLIAGSAATSGGDLFGFGAGSGGRLSFFIFVSFLAGERLEF